MTENKFTYVQYSAIRGKYKIGFTRKSNGEDRRKSGTIYLPDLCIICICSFETITESELKTMYQHKREKGTEWFDLNNVDVSKIKSIMSKDDEYFDSELVFNKLRLQIGMLCEMQYRKGLQHGADFTERKWITHQEISSFRHNGYIEGFTNVKDPIRNRTYKLNEIAIREIDDRFATLQSLLESKDYTEFLCDCIHLQLDKELWYDYNSTDLKKSLKHKNG